MCVLNVGVGQALLFPLISIYQSDRRNTVHPKMDNLQAES